MKSLVVGLAAAALSAVPVHAREASALYGACYMRIYDAAHLQSRPGQRVVQVQAAFRENEGALWAGVYYTLADGKRYGLSGDCFAPVAGGFLCQVCANDVCDQTGETFKVLGDGGLTLDLVNDTTGITGFDARGGLDTLEAGGANDVFRLDRLSDPTACDWLPP